MSRTNVWRPHCARNGACAWVSLRTICLSKQRPETFNGLLGSPRLFQPRFPFSSPSLPCPLPLHPPLPLLHLPLPLLLILASFWLQVALRSVKNGFSVQIMVRIGSIQCQSGAIRTVAVTSVSRNSSSKLVSWLVSNLLIGIRLAN